MKRFFHCNCRKSCNCCKRFHTFCNATLNYAQIDGTATHTAFPIHFHTQYHVQFFKTLHTAGFTDTHISWPLSALQPTVLNRVCCNVCNVSKNVWWWKLTETGILDFRKKWYWKNFVSKQCKSIHSLVHIVYWYAECVKCFEQCTWYRNKCENDWKKL